VDTSVRNFTFTFKAQTTDGTVSQFVETASLINLTPVITSCPDGNTLATVITDTFVTQIQGGIGAAGGNASRVIIRAESRDIKNGGVWRPLGRELTVPISGVGVQFDPHPFLIIPKNHDIRLRARTDSNTAFVFGEINGYLAGIVT
jgi:hypothetical protein